MKTKRVMAVRIAPEYMQEFITEGWRGDGLSIINGLPKGAKWVNTHIDAAWCELVMVFEHESFDEVEAGSPIPTLTPTVCYSEENL